ncbi:MAG TPA: hypothetical protein VN696_08540 [Pyrinomonadaceae bacterium]|nr:hypothetical protein [Pyrinomonadaceae bacterium]
MNTLKRILLIIGLLLAPASSLPAMQADWIKFAPPGGGFSVLLPAQPKELELTPVPDFSAHGYGVTVDGVVYVCLFGDYAASVHLNPDAELAANRDNFLKALNASLISTKKIELDGRAGLEFTGESADSNLQSQVYLVGNRVYQIAIAVPKGTDASADASRFLKSFAFAGNKEHAKP